jgi:hypothetical protein
MDATKLLGSMTRRSYLEMGALSKAFYRKYGKEALPLITGVMSQSGVESGKMLQQMGTDKSMNAIAEGYKGIMPVLGLKMDVIELTDKAVRFKTSQCPYGIEGTSRELCEAMMAGDRKSMSTLLGQEVEGKILKSVAAGDEECEVVFSKK